MAKVLVSLCLLCSLNSCAVVRTTDSAGRHHVAMVSGPLLNIAPFDASSIGNVQAIGVSRTPLGVTLGYTQQEFVIDDGSCRIVVWINEAVEAQELLDFLKTEKNVCVSNQ